MNQSELHHTPALSDADFKRFSEFVYAQCGVKLPPAKKTMLMSRLSKRLRICGLQTFRQYYDYVISPEGRENELTPMIDAVTTNKTDFFREAAHFDYLVDHALPQLTRLGRGTGGRKLCVWSAGCSSGEEPYTLAMVMAEYFTRKAGEFSILATDISTRVLEKARQAIYPEEAVVPVPKNMKYRYFLKGKGSRTGFCRVAPELRRHVTLLRLNLVEGRDFDIKAPMDIIFCRNVIIYFDRVTQQRLFEKFFRVLVPGGYMFIGHSETLHGINEHFLPVATSVYRKPEK
ncbi:MAG: CheR family methyltransferase [Thermodesulfobacteriota bacterium]